MSNLQYSQPLSDGSRSIYDQDSGKFIGRLMPSLSQKTFGATSRRFTPNSIAELAAHMEKQNGNPRTS